MNAIEVKNLTKKDKEGNYGVDFFHISAKSNEAEILGKYLKKGDVICLAGSMNSRDYIDPKTNEPKLIWELNVQNHDFIRTEAKSGKAEKVEAQPELKEVEEEEDIF